MRRLRTFGPNELPAVRRRPAALRILAQLTLFMALLLWAAGALSFVAGMPQLGWAIFAVVLVNGAFGAWQEHRAERALAALEALVPRVREALATCRRTGVTVTVVTGDHALTARAIAEDVGLWSEAARVVDGAGLDALDEPPSRRCSPPVPRLSSRARRPSRSCVWSGRTSGSAARWR